MLETKLNQSMAWNTRFATLVCITIAAAASRLIPHPPNFTPIAAIALFGGAYFSSIRAAFAVPIAAMFLSNVALGLMRYGSAVVPLLPFVYGSFALTVCMGIVLRKKRTPWAIGVAALSSAIVFFVLTNFGVWIKGRMYPLSIDGLVTCYVASIPFFRNMVLGNIVYVTVLFGSFELAVRHFPELREPRIAPT